MVNYIKKLPLFLKLTRTYIGKLTDNTKEIKVTKDCNEDIDEIKKNPKRASMVQNKFFNKNSIKLIDKHTLA